MPKRAVVCLVLLFAAALAVQAQEEAPVPQEDRPQEQEHKNTYPDLEMLMMNGAEWMAPAHVRPRTGFAGLTLLPIFEGAERLDPAMIRIGLDAGVTHNHFTDQGGSDVVDLRATLIEAGVSVGWGTPIEGLEARARLGAGNWMGHLQVVHDGINVLEDRTIDSVVADFTLGGKYALWELEDSLTGAAISVGVKIPTGDEDENLSTDTVDVAAALHFTYGGKWLAVHGQIGYSFLGDADLFRSQANVGSDSVASFGAGVTWHLIDGMAVIAQTYAHQNPYGDIEVDGFEGWTWALGLGTRLAVSWTEVEALVLLPLTDDTADIGVTIGVNQRY